VSSIIVLSYTRILTGSSDGRARLWDVEEQNSVGYQEFNHKRSITGVLQLNDNKIITVPYWGSIKVWNIDKEDCITTIDTSTPVSWVMRLDDSHILVGLDACPFIAKFEIDGTQVDFSYADPIVDFYPNLGPIMDLFPEKELTDWIGFGAQLKETVGDGLIDCLTKYDDNFLIGGTNTGQVFIWNKDNPSEQHAFFNVPTRKKHVLFLACLEVNGSRRIVTRHYWTRRVWEVVDMDLNNHTLELRECFSCAEDVCAVAILDDAHRIVEGTCDGRVRVFNLNTGSFSWTRRAHDSGVSSIIVLKSDGRILTGSFDGTARLWNHQEQNSMCCSWLACRRTVPDE
jgi:WD40 repeat protein